MTDGLYFCFAEDSFMLGKAIMKDGQTLEIIELSDETIRKDGIFLSKKISFVLSNQKEYRYREWVIKDGSDKKQHTFDMVTRNWKGAEEFVHTNDIIELYTYV